MNPPQPRMVRPALFLIDSQPLTLRDQRGTDGSASLRHRHDPKTGWERAAEFIVRYAASEIARSRRNKMQTGTANNLLDMQGSDIRSAQITTGKS
jgi:hypothetical protein